MTEAVLTMRARPFSFARALSAGMASRQSRNIARTLTPFTRSQCSSVISSTKARPLTPALLNRMSMAPNLASASATIFFGASSPVMSQPRAAMALLPTWACSIAEPGRSTARTCAPSSANNSADAAPMPEAAPVMIAILPASLVIVVSLSRHDGWSFDLHARRQRHALPERQILLQDLTERLRPVSDRIGAKLDQTVAHLGRERSIDEGALELAKHRARDAARCHHARPHHHLGGGPAGFGHGRHLGQERRA